MHCELGGAELSSANLALIVQPLGSTALNASGLSPWEASRPLAVLDAVSLGDNNDVEVARRLRMPDSHVRPNLDEAVRHYDAKTVAHAVSRAIGGWDIVIARHNSRGRLPAYGAELLGYVSAGHTAPEISQIMDRPLHAVQEVFMDVCVALGVKPNATAATRRAYETGILDLPRRPNRPQGLYCYVQGRPAKQPSPAQKDLLRDRWLGLSYLESGQRRGRSEDTQKTHARRLFKMLDAKNMTQALTMAIALGWIEVTVDPANAPLLTKRELEVVALILQGNTDARVGATLFITTDTAKTHTGRIFSRFGVRSREMLVRRLFETGVCVVPSSPARARLSQ
jgi:DNA-binding CsgD family transcriptional regulator